MKDAKTASDLMRVIESKNEYYAAFLKKICEIESKSDNKAGVDRVCDAVLEEGRKLGFSERLFPHPAAGNVASLTYDPGSKKRIICLSAHMDTVFPEGTFGYPAVKRDGDILRGPGVMDCKGGIAVALLIYPLFKKLLRRANNLPCFIITWVLVVFMAVDLTATCIAVYRWGERQVGHEPKTKIGAFFDEHYGDKRMQSIFVNMNFNPKHEQNGE